MVKQKKAPRYHRRQWEPGAIAAGDELFRAGEIRPVLAVREENTSTGIVGVVSLGFGEELVLNAGDEYRVAATGEGSGDDEQENG